LRAGSNYSSNLSNELGARPLKNPRPNKEMLRLTARIELLEAQRVGEDGEPITLRVGDKQGTNVVT
jgi:hypothetical protein